MLKKYFTDPSFLFLIAGNIYCIWYYQNHPNAFATVIWIYWFQSVTIGLFNFLDLLTNKNYAPADVTINGKPVRAGANGCLAWFFLVHYGIFHLVYAVFLLVDFGISSINKMILLIGIATFFLESIMNFIRQRRSERSLGANIGIMFFLPYLRIIPMHLMILLPAFLGWKPSLLFLVLKMGADIFSYLIYHFINNKEQAMPAS